jgi:hypothetical protein
VAIFCWWVKGDVMNKIEWSMLEATWRGLTEMMQNYETYGEGYATLCEARRLTEVEMHEQGYDTELATLTENEA